MTPTLIHGYNSPDENRGRVLRATRRSHKMVYPHGKLYSKELHVLHDLLQASECQLDVHVAHVAKVIKMFNEAAHKTKGIIGLGNWRTKNQRVR